MTTTHQPGPAPDDMLRSGAPRVRREDAIGTPPESPTLVPSDRYTSPAFAQMEVEKMWTRVWQFACMVDHVAEPGDYYEYRCGPYSVLIVRDQDGQLRAFQNSCRHRGTALCDGAGSGLRELKCGYHGWTWDLAGTLRRVPRRGGFGSLRMAEFPLFPVRVDTWERMVFINLDLGAMPLADYLEEVPGDIAWCSLGDFRCYGTITVEVEANWKTIVDGFSETYHVQTLHPELQRCMDDVYAPQQIWGHAGKSVADYGVQSPAIKKKLSDREVWDAYLRTQGALMGLPEDTPLPESLESEQTVQDLIADRTRSFAAQRGVDLGWADTSQMMRLNQYNVFPNMTLLTSADHLTLIHSKPGHDPDHGEMVMVLMTRMPPGAPRLTPADVRFTADDAHPGLVMEQDISVLAKVQRGLHQPGMTHLVLSNEERRIINLHRNLERYLNLPEKERTTGGQTKSD